MSKPLTLVGKYRITYWQGAVVGGVLRTFETEATDVYDAMERLRVCFGPGSIHHRIEELKQPVPRQDWKVFTSKCHACEYGEKEWHSMG